MCCLFGDAPSAEVVSCDTARHASFMCAAMVGAHQHTSPGLQSGDGRAAGQAGHNSTDRLACLYAQKRYLHIGNGMGAAGAIVVGIHTRPICTSIGKAITQVSEHALAPSVVFFLYHGYEEEVSVCRLSGSVH